MPKEREIKAVVERKAFYTVIHAKSLKAVERTLSQFQREGHLVRQKPKLIKGRYYASVKNQTLN